MEETIYTYILTKTDGTYLGWSKSSSKPSTGTTANMQWIEWNKPLPDDIDTLPYKHIDGELVQYTDLTLYKNEISSEITRIRDQRINDGFTYMGKTIQSDNVSQSIARQYLVESLSDSCEFPIIWRTKENDYMSIPDIENLNLFLDAMKTSVSTHFKESWTAKDAIIMAATKEEIDTIFEEYKNENGDLEAV